MNSSRRMNLRRSECAHEGEHWTGPGFLSCTTTREGGAERVAMCAGDPLKSGTHQEMEPYA